MTHRKLISFDWAIKKVLRDKANFGILEGFLSELLFTDITILEVLESESNPQAEDDKLNRVDIKVKDRDGRIMLIEVQYSRELDYLQRILYGSSKTIAEHMYEGQAYANVSKVISINILYFVFGKGNDYIYHGTTRFIGFHNKKELELTKKQQTLYKVSKIKDIYPEYYLIELKNFEDITHNTLDEWIYFLKNEQIKGDFTAKGLEEAQKTLDVLKMDDEERWAYDRYQAVLRRQASLYESTYVLGQIEGEEKGRREGKEEGIREGEEKGRREGMKEGEARGVEKGVLLMAQNMKQRGIDIATIADVTGLSITEIENL